MVDVPIGPVMKKRSLSERIGRALQRDKYLIVMILPAVALMILFKYLPMYGVLIAFEDYSVSKGILGSTWVGLKQFVIFFRDQYALRSLSGVNPELYEAARLDGASKLQKIRYIDIPTIIPTVTIIFILGVGSILGTDFQRVLLLYNPLTYEVADVLATYTYRAGILGASYSYASAVGLFTSIVSFVFIFSTNQISRRVGETSLW